MSPIPHFDPDKLQRIIERAVLPALQRTIQDASRAAVHEVDGYCDQAISADRLDDIADDITVLLADYLNDITHRDCANGPYRQITTHDLHTWATKHDLQP
jgi:hypothetical protein